MQELFVRFGASLQGALPIALAAALVWGVLSVLLSPCHLATIPLVVGYVSGAGPDVPRRRAVALSGAFAGGMFLSLALIGAVVALAGQALVRYKAWASLGTAIVMVIAGLHLLEMISLPSLKPWAPARKGVLAAVAAGLFVGVGLGPCTLGFVAPVLGLVLGASTTHAAFGWAILVAFAVGHCAVVGGAGASTALVQRYVAWSARGVGVFKKVCGALVLLGAALLVYGA